MALTFLRCSFILGTVLISISTVLLVSSASSRAQEDRLALCESCHVEAEILLLASQIPVAERKSQLNSYLFGHFAPDASNREDIITYLLSTVDEPPAGTASEED